MRTRFDVERVLLPLGAAALAIAAWSLAVRLTHTTVFPSPLQVAAGYGAAGAVLLLLERKPGSTSGGSA